MATSSGSSNRVRCREGELGIIDSNYVPGAKAVGMGATQLEAPEDRGHGFITATAVDPFGNLLGIMYNPHYLEILSSLKPA